MTKSKEFPCSKCPKIFTSALARAGHVGGKHSRALVPIRHGEEYGYVQHVRRKEPVDDEDSCGCRAAHSLYQRERRQKLRAVAA